MVEEAEVPQATDNQARAEVQALLDDPTNGLTQSQVAREIGYSGATIGRWLRGSYGADAQRVQSAVERWLGQRRSRAAMEQEMPAPPPWVETPSARQIRSVLEFARHFESMGAAYGGPGVGKTSTIERYQATSTNVWLVTASPASNQPPALIWMIAEAVGLRPSGNTAAYTLEREIIDEVRGRHGLLVIDDAHHLSLRALDAVRAIHDQAHVGVVLAGNETVYSQLSGGTRALHLAQLFSRIGMKRALTRPTLEDIDAVIDGYAISDAGVRKLCRHIGRKPGALRGLAHTLRMAAMYARAAGEQLSRSHIQQAWADLGGGEATA